VALSDYSLLVSVPDMATLANYITVNSIKKTVL